MLDKAAEPSNEYWNAPSNIFDTSAAAFWSRGSKCVSRVTVENPASPAATVNVPCEPRTGSARCRWRQRDHREQDLGGNTSCLS